MELFPELFLVGFKVTPLVDLFILLEGLILFPSLNEDFFQSTIDSFLLFFPLSLSLALALLYGDSYSPLATLSPPFKGKKRGAKRGNGRQQNKGYGQEHQRGKNTQGRSSQYSTQEEGGTRRRIRKINKGPGVGAPPLRPPIDSCPLPVPNPA